MAIDACIIKENTQRNTYQFIGEPSIHRGRHGISTGTDEEYQADDYWGHVVLQSR